YGAVRKVAGASPPFVLQTSSSPLPVDAATVAWGGFNDSIAAVGWATLELHTAAAFANADQAFAAGYLEGALTVDRTWEFVNNAFGLEPFDEAVTGFLVSNFEYIGRQVKANAADPYWHHVGLLFEQQRGMHEGYLATAPAAKRLSFMQYYAATMSGDMDDLSTVFNVTKIKSLRSSSHCSVLIKPVGNINAPTELLATHTTWGSFETLTRVYKMYDMPLTLTDAQRDVIPGRYMAFSSYPATLFRYVGSRARGRAHTRARVCVCVCVYVCYEVRPCSDCSDDDWYITGANMTITETTIENHNASLWQYVVPTTVLDWTRNMAANRLANSGKEWTTLFARENSGYARLCARTSRCARQAHPAAAHKDRFPAHSACKRLQDVQQHVACSRLQAIQSGPATAGQLVVGAGTDARQVRGGCRPDCRAAKPSVLGILQSVRNGPHPVLHVCIGPTVCAASHVLRRMRCVACAASHALRRMRCVACAAPALCLSASLRMFARMRLHSCVAVCARPPCLPSLASGRWCICMVRTTRTMPRPVP
ncbi:hypothetical protein EON66_04245, partial [archaeon]